MHKNLSNKKLILKHNFYLSNCDLLNKYLLKSVYNTPALNKIVLHFSIGTIKTSSLQDSNIKIKCFLIFYLCFSLLSYINFLKVKTSDADYSLKIILNGCGDINAVLFNLIVENNFKFFKEDFQGASEKTDSFNYNVLIPFQKFIGEDLTFLVKSEIKTSFSFSNFCHLNNKKLAVKNLPLLWMAD
jgi:hypothetical protein